MRYAGSYLVLVFPRARGATGTADTAPRCDDGGDGCRDGGRGGVPACLGADRRCRRARDGERTRTRRAAAPRCGARSPWTTPSPAGTGSGRSGFPGVPSFWRVLLLLSQRPTTVITELKNRNPKKLRLQTNARVSQTSFRVKRSRETHTNNNATYLNVILST